MIDILIWKKKCSGYSLGLKKAAEVNLEIDKYILLLNNFKRITDLYYESNLIQADNEKYSKAEVLKKLKSILNQPELKNEKNALSFSAKIFYYLIYSNYYYSIDDKQNEYNHLQKLVDILNQSKTYAIENPLDYVSIYNRLLSIKKFFPKSTFFEDIQVLKEFPQKITIRQEVIAERVFIHINTHKLEYYLINNDFNSALNKIKDIEKEISKLNMDIEPYHMIYFYYLHAITLIYVGEFHKALKFINKTLNEFEFEARPQVYLRIEVLNVITHYELKNNSLVTSLSKQVLKKNQSKNILTSFEERILNVLYKITNIKHLTSKEEASMIHALANELSNSKQSNQLSVNLLNENYEKWVIAKIKRKHVYELYK
jgi:predicted translin family RNA/ssDNA-binding protein